MKKICSVQDSLFVWVSLCFVWFHCVLFGFHGVLFGFHCALFGFHCVVSGFHCVLCYTDILFVVYRSTSPLQTYNSAKRRASHVFSGTPPSKVRTKYKAGVYYT